jgi:hypothetical protein
MNVLCKLHLYDSSQQKCSKLVTYSALQLKIKEKEQKSIFGFKLFLFRAPSKKAYWSIFLIDFFSKVSSCLKQLFLLRRFSYKMKFWMEFAC